MPRTETATCQDCGWRGPVEDTKEFRHLYERVHPGDVMPAGDCPVEGCGGAAMLDDERRDADDLRPAMVALMLGLDRLHESIATGDPRAPIGAHVKELADYARKALAAGPRCNPSATPAAAPVSRSMRGRAGMSIHSAGCCTALMRPPPSAPTATSSAATR